MDDGPIFLSAVTREFGTARDRLANIPRGARSGCGANSRNAPALQRKSHDYIKACETVVRLIGAHAAPDRVA
jgi:hypothetical protein